MVLWHVQNEEPIKLFSITGSINSLAMFGKKYCEALYICADNKVLRVHIESVPNFRRSNKLDIMKWKEKAFENRQVNKRKHMGGTTAQRKPGL